MMEDQELRFVCKLCDKKYSCGKSLGGHMRSHVAANSAESEEKIEGNAKNISSSTDYTKNFIKESRFSESGNGQSSYGLRENPKKTWRACNSDSRISLERVCKKCGKGFSSLKALCGHMACHSEKEKSLKDDDDHSWTGENQKMVMDSDSGTEMEDRKQRIRSSKRIVVKSSSSGSKIDEQEQEDLAKCLMMLSRDLGNKGGVNSNLESSDNNSVELETKSSSFDMRFDRKQGSNHVLDHQETLEIKKSEDMKLKNCVLDDEIADSDSGYFLYECNYVESDASVDGSPRNGTSGECKKSSMNIGVRPRAAVTELKRELAKEYRNNDAGIASNFIKRKYASKSPEPLNRTSRKMKRKYECVNCEMTFDSYQGLGGHRPCNRKSKASSESSSLDDATLLRTVVKLRESSSKKGIKPMKSSSHVCPFCHRVFKNGQALGGHKRSHFITGHEEYKYRTPINKPEHPDWLDLNLPSPDEDEDDGDGW